MLNSILISLIAMQPTLANAEFLSVHNDNRGYEVFSMKVANPGEAPLPVSVCTKDVQLVLNDPARSKSKAFAVSFEGSNWKHGCAETIIPANASTKLKLYVRKFGAARVGRALDVKTSAGYFRVAG